MIMPPFATIINFFNIIPTPFINVLYYAFAYKSSTFTKYNSHTLLPKAIPLLIRTGYCIDSAEDSQYWYQEDRQ